jgi:cell division protein FtsZ
MDYQQLDRPTVIRKRGIMAKPLSETTMQDVDYLDIPAFLRRQEEV